MGFVRHGRLFLQPQNIAIIEIEMAAGEPVDDRARLAVEL